MPDTGVVENLKIFLNVVSSRAESPLVWIERIVSQTSEGLAELDLHERLTVVASLDAARRLRPYRQVHAALAATPGTIIEARTEYSDSITAHRGPDGTMALYDTHTKLPRQTDERGLGIVAQLNIAPTMAEYMSLFHVSSDSLRQRALRDSDLIGLARSPLDQLFELASQITASEARLSEARTRRSDLTDSIREREEKEQTISEQLEATSVGMKKINFFAIASFATIALGVASAATGSLLVAGALCGIALALAGAGYALNKRVASRGGVSVEELDIQLGRVDELFDTHSLSRSRRDAEGSLAESIAQWKAVAGDIKPAVLVSDRPRIEELASHLRLIDNEDVTPADTEILVGFASLLAELNRRFPAERVPLLVDDLFPSVAPQYHGVLSELILRASHRRQVILETGDPAVAKWAAVEAVGGGALLISDFDFEVEPIINEAVAAQSAA